MESKHNLSKNLKALRKLRGTSQVNFAKELGIAKSTLQEIEQGKSPNLDTVDCIADSLNIPTPVLLSDSLSPDHLSIMVQLVRYVDSFAKWKPESQNSLVKLLLQVSELVQKEREASGENDE